MFAEVNAKVEHLNNGNQFTEKTTVSNAIFNCIVQEIFRLKEI